MQNNLHKFIAMAAASTAMSHVSAIEPSDLLLYQVGPLALKPQFAVSETFNDNIFYSEQNENADLISSVSPGIALQVGRKDFNYLDLRYSYERLIYLDHSELDANQHHFASKLKIQKNRLTLDGNDSIELLSTPIGGGYSANSADRVEGVAGIGGLRIDRGIFFDLYRLTWDASERTDLYVQLSHSFIDYQDDLPLYDSRTLSGTLGFEYRPFAKTYFFGETYFGETENSANIANLFEYPTADFVGFFAGVRGQFTERLRGTAKAGFEHRVYSDDGPDFNAPVVEIGLDYQLSDKTTFNLGYSRRQNESIQFIRSPYTTDAISASWYQQIGADGRLRSVLRAGYWLSSFEPVAGIPQDRSDEILNASLTLSYDIKVWIRAFGSYSFEKLNSNLPSIEDYNVNRIMLGLQVGY